MYTSGENIYKLEHVQQLLCLLKNI